MDFSSFVSIRKSVKERMHESPLNRLEGPPTYVNMERLVEQFAISAASVRIETGETTVWASGDYGCLPIALSSTEVNSATGGQIANNDRLALPDDVNKEITDKTTPTDILRLTKKQETLWVAYLTQEAATEIGVNQTADAVDEQYLIELK